MILLETASQTSDWALFFGHFHPLLVHLPIGFLMIAAALEILKIWGKLTVNQGVINFILLVSAISATFACIAGYLLSLGGGYEEEILDEHKWQGIWLAVFSWIAWMSKTNFVSERISFATILYFPSLIIATFMMFVAGHHGGSLTHGSNYLSENTPEPFRDWFGISPKAEVVEEKIVIKDINQAMVFKDVVHPILKNKCEKCHNAQKSKGDLRMDSIELLKKGGKNGEIFVAGNAEKSEMMKRFLLPLEDEHHMPPKGKPQPTENEIALVKWWIEQGASFDKKVSQLAVNEQVKPILGALAGGAIAVSMKKDSSKTNNGIPEIPSIEDKLFAQKVPDLDPKAVEEIKKTGALLIPMAQNNNFVEISYINNHSFSDANSAVLSKLSEQTAWLKLGETQISDKSLAEISKLKNLTRLHLENTKITDAGLANLKNLQNLEYINLLGTQISDTGLKQIFSCKNLKKVYAWKTKITENGIAEMKKSLPNVKIDIGISEKQVTEFLKAKPTGESDDVYKKTEEKKEVKKK